MHHHCPCPPAHQHHCHRPYTPPAPRALPMTLNPYPALFPYRPPRSSSSSSSCTVRVETPPPTRDDAAAPLLEPRPDGAGDDATLSDLFCCLVIFMAIVGGVVYWFCYRH